MDTPRNGTSVIPPRASSSGAMTAIAVLLGFLVVDRIAAPVGSNGALGPATASAQVRSVSSAPGGRDSSADDEPTVRTNPAEQNKQIIAELKAISQRLDRMDAMLSKGLSVKVTDMPEMRLPKALADKLGERNGN